MSRFPGASRAFVLVVVYAGAVVACWAVFPFLLPPPRVDQFDQKRSYFLAHPNEFDTVFIGSSCFYHGIIPSQFDEATRSLGRATHSFNFGIDGMVPPESFFASRKIIKLSSRLRWVFIELPPIDSHIDNVNSVRALWWHDSTHTLIALREGWWNGGKSMAVAATHARLFWRYHANLGRGGDVLAELLRLRRRIRPLQPLHLQPSGVKKIGEDGFVPMDKPALTRETAGGYLAALESYRGASATVTIAENLRGSLRQLIADIRAAGATPIFVITPFLNPQARLSDLRSQGIDAELLALNDPEKFPAIFEPPSRTDIAHLSAVGAREFTRLLAEYFSASTREREEKAAH